MIIYRGAGLVVVFALAAFIPLCYAINYVYGKDYYQSHAWPKGFCLLITGALVWCIGKYLNRKAKKRYGEAFHYFMFVKMEYWGFIYGFFGVLYLAGLQ
jgi:hypothetical protein